MGNYLLTARLGVRSVRPFYIAYPTNRKTDGPSGVESRREPCNSDPGGLLSYCVGSYMFVMSCVLCCHGVVFTRVRYIRMRSVCLCACGVGAHLVFHGVGVSFVSWWCRRRWCRRGDGVVVVFRLGVSVGRVGVSCQCRSSGRMVIVRLCPVCRSLSTRVWVRVCLSFIRVCSSVVSTLLGTCVRVCFFLPGLWGIARPLSVFVPYERSVVSISVARRVSSVGGGIVGRVCLFV